MIRLFQKSIGITALLFASLTAANAQAPSAAPKYFPINPPQMVDSGDKIQVVEVFSYGCIHCAQFQPHVDAYLKRLDPNKIQFVYLPAPFNPQYALLARGFYAADSMGMTKAVHQKVFEAIFTKNTKIQNFDDVVAMYESFGVKRDAFMKAAQSFLVETQLRRANELVRAYRIDGTPTVIVAGKYRVTSESAGGHDNVFKVVEELVKQEQAAKSTAKK